MTNEFPGFGQAYTKIKKNISLSHTKWTNGRRCPTKTAFEGIEQRFKEP